MDGPGKALLESSRGKGWTYHCFVPDNSHPLFYAIDALGDQSEVVLAHSLLSSTVGTVATTCDLQVSTGKSRKEAALHSLQTADSGMGHPAQDWHFKCWWLYVSSDGGAGHQGFYLSIFFFISSSVQNSTQGLTCATQVNHPTLPQ